MSFDNYFIKSVKSRILIILFLFVFGFASIYYLINNLTGSNQYYQLQIQNKLMVHETRDLERLYSNIPKEANFDIVKKILKQMYEIYYYNKDNNVILDSLFYFDNKLKLREVSNVKKVIIDFKFTSELSRNEIVKYLEDKIKDLNIDLPENYEQQAIQDLFDSQLNEIYLRILDFFSQNKKVLLNANVTDPGVTNNHIEFNKDREIFTPRAISTGSLINILTSVEGYDFAKIKNIVDNSEIINRYISLINEYNILSDKTNFLLSELNLIYPDFVNPIEIINFEQKTHQRLYLDEYSKILISLFLTFALILAYLIGNYFYLLVKSSINDK